MKLTDVTSLKTIYYFPKKVFFDEALHLSGMKEFLEAGTSEKFYEDKDGEMHYCNDLLLVD